MIFEAAAEGAAFGAAQGSAQGAAPEAPQDAALEAAEQGVGVEAAIGSVSPAIEGPGITILEPIVGHFGFMLGSK